MVRVDPRQGKYLKVIRLPWGAGTITNIAAGNGTVMVTGLTGSNFKKLGAAESLSAIPGGDAEVFLLALVQNSIQSNG